MHTLSNAWMLIFCTLAVPELLWNAVMSANQSSLTSYRASDIDPCDLPMFCDSGTTLPFPGNCHQFIWCVHGVWRVENCANGTMYDANSTEHCNHRSDGIYCRPECPPSTGTTPELVTIAPGVCNEDNVTSCMENTKYPDRSSCYYYYLCTGGRLIRMPCPNGTVYEIETSTCIIPFASFDCFQRCGWQDRISGSPGITQNISPVQTGVTASSSEMEIDTSARLVVYTSEVQTTRDETLSQSTELIDPIISELPTTAAGEVPTTTTRAPPTGPLTLTITAKDNLTDFNIDGVLINIPSNRYWWDPVVLTLPEYTRLIAVRAVATLEINCPGILASVTDDYLVTDYNWRCTRNGGPGFPYLGFDDSSWAPAHIVGQNGIPVPGCPNITEIPSISRNAYLLWVSVVGEEAVAYCRGYTPLCDISNPCLNNGTCLKNDPRLCACPPGWSGKFCDFDMLNPCANLPCQNNATCVPLSNSTEVYRCSCYFGYTGVNCETKVESLNLTITAKETLGALYIDGTQILPVDYQTDWSTPMVVSIPVHTRLVAVMGANINNTCAGILGSVSYEFLLTDVEWRCAPAARIGWSNLGYVEDNLWEGAVETGSNADYGIYPCVDTTIRRIPEISSNAKWIWTNDSQGHDLTVYCRGYLPICEARPCQNGGTCNRNNITLCNCLPGFTGLFCQDVEMLPLSITAREELNVLYVDSVQLPLQNGLTWNVADQTSMFPTTRLIAALAMDVRNLTGNCYGLLGSVGIEGLVTNTTDWKCTLNAEVGWFQLGFNDAQWLPADSLGPNVDDGRCLGMAGIPEISSDAAWIWTSNPGNPNNPGLVAFCRGYLNICDYLPCQNGGTCNRNSHLLCRCSSGYTGTYCESRIGYDVPEDAMQLCQNGAQVQMTAKGVNCLCASGYTGHWCDTELNECSKGPCKNGGKCVDLVNAYQCLCPDGYFGFNCEVKRRFLNKRRHL